MRRPKYAVFFFVCFLLTLNGAAAGETVIHDDAGQELTFTVPPRRVVSLLPLVTELIETIGASEAVAGRTFDDTHLPGLTDKPVIGGAFTPQFDLIVRLKPDLVIVAPRLFDQTRKQLPNTPILVWDDGASLGEAEAKIAWLGAIFHKEAEAEKVRLSNQALMDLIAAKTAKIPPGKRLRVMRVALGKEGLSSPGTDSFQTGMIEAAGAIAPRLGPGAFVPVSLEQWRDFNPQAIYACGPGREDLRRFLDQPGWREAEAVRQGRVFRFPCALTCRAAAHTGYFVAWLAALLYEEDFIDGRNLVLPEKVLGERPVSLALPYVRKARITEARILDFTHRALLIDFTGPRRVISTEGGQREGIGVIGNAFSPPPAWGIYHRLGAEKARRHQLQGYALDAGRSEILSTGADMNNLVVKTASFRDLSVTALVTAGVGGNALRAGKDTGAYYEPGTINILILSSHALSPAAASRTLITVTEAKTAALWDMDIRSTQTPLDNPATGTGTDSIIVVSGDQKPELRFSGGHSTLGQLISEAVYGAVQEAIRKQNGKALRRTVFERLEERGLLLHSLLGGPDCPCQGQDRDFQARLERLLLEPRYQGFLEAAFALSDARAMGQVDDLAAFADWAGLVAEGIAKRPVDRIEAIVSHSGLPEPLALALNALGTGLKYAPSSSLAPYPASSTLAAEKLRRKPGAVGSKSE